MMDQSAVNAIAELARAEARPLTAGDGTVLVVRDGKVVDSASLRHRVEPRGEKFTTLSGLLSYVALMPDHITALKIVSPQLVVGLGRYDETFKLRDQLAWAQVAPRDWLGKEMDQTTALVVLMTECEQTEARDALVKLVRTLVASEEMKAEDDGMSTRVTVKKAAGISDTVSVQPLHKLMCRQTFSEVDQPERLLYVRIRKNAALDGGFGITLHAADTGGAWEGDCMERIAAYLLAEYLERSEAIADKLPILS